jgi:hypothetical protein
MQQTGPNPSSQGANGQNLHTIGVYIMTVQIRGHTVDHLLKVIRGPHKNVIVGTNFINKHKLNHDPCQRQFTWGSQPRRLKGQLLISKAITLQLRTTKAVHIDLVTEEECIPNARNDCLAFISTTKQPYGDLIGSRQMTLAKHGCPSAMGPPFPLT